MYTKYIAFIAFIIRQNDVCMALAYRTYRSFPVHTLYSLKIASLVDNFRFICRYLQCISRRHIKNFFKIIIFKFQCWELHILWGTMYIPLNIVYMVSWKRQRKKMFTRKMPTFAHTKNPTRKNHTRKIDHIAKSHKRSDGPFSEYSEKYCY